MSNTEIKWNDGKSTLTLTGDAGDAIAKAWHTMLHHGFGVVIISSNGTKCVPLHEYISRPKLRLDEDDE